MAGEEWFKVDEGKGMWGVVENLGVAAFVNCPALAYIDAGSTCDVTTKLPK